MAELTLGEKRVKVDFNVTNNSLVDQVKKDTAVMLNLCESMRSDESGSGTSEKQRLISLAQTAYEEAAMWIVKANFTK